MPYRKEFLIKSEGKAYLFTLQFSSNEEFDNQPYRWSNRFMPILVEPCKSITFKTMQLPLRLLKVIEGKTSQTRLLNHAKVFLDAKPLIQPIFQSQYKNGIGRIAKLSNINGIRSHPYRQNKIFFEGLIKMNMKTYFQTRVTCLNIAQKLSNCLVAQS